MKVRSRRSCCSRRLVGGTPISTDKFGKDWSILRIRTVTSDHRERIRDELTIRNACNPVTKHEGPDQSTLCEQFVDGGANRREEVAD